MKHVGSKHMRVHAAEVDVVGEFHYNGRGVGLPWRRADSLPFMGVYSVNIHDVDVVGKCCWTLAERTVAGPSAGSSRLSLRMSGLASRGSRRGLKLTLGDKVRSNRSGILLLEGPGVVY